MTPEEKQKLILKIDYLRFELSDLIDIEVIEADLDYIDTGDLVKKILSVVSEGLLKDEN